MTDRPITLEIINEHYQQILAQCKEIVPLHNWSVEPCKEVQLTHRKGDYGLACNDGTIHISHAFLGTTAYNKLKNTLIHELTHLCVSLNKNHNKVFRRCERMFGGSAEIDEQEDTQIRSNIDYKWRIIAHLENGEQVDLGGAHRKTKKWSQYDGKDTSTKGYLHNGHKIMRFEFLPFDDAFEANA